MILAIIILATILTFYGFLFMKSDGLGKLVGYSAIAILALSVGMLTHHFSSHWGMKQVATTETKPIYTAGDVSASFGLVIKSQVGTKADNYVLVYRDKADSQDATAHFKPDMSDVSKAVKFSATYKLSADAKKAQVTTTTKRWQWQNKLAEWCFGFGGEAGELASKQTVVVVPKNTWLVLTQEQAKDLQVKSKDLQAQVQAQLQQDPEKAKTLMAEKTSNPDQYAAFQVAQIKSLLGIKE